MLDTESQEGRAWEEPEASIPNKTVRKELTDPEGRQQTSRQEGKAGAEGAQVQVGTLRWEVVEVPSREIKYSDLWVNTVFFKMQFIHNNIHLFGYPTL